MSASLFLAIDGGNSKTDVVIGTGDGDVLSFLRGPRSSPHTLGIPGAMRLLSALVEQARAAAGLPVSARLAQASVFLAGADLPIEVSRLQAAVGALDWANVSTIDNDTFALLRTGTANPDAIAVVCGAGINCVGRRADGRTARFPSLGSISGDWGGGHHLAALALWHAARGEDGRGPATALCEAVAAYFGQSTVEQLSAALHLGDIPAERIEELGEVLFAVAAAGDPVAAGVVAQQADEVVAMVRVAGSRLGLLSVPHAVVLGGGVLRARHPLLHEAVVAGIGQIAPLADVDVVTDPPVVGAALLALDALADGGPDNRGENRVDGRVGGRVGGHMAPAAAEAALREALRRPPAASAAVVPVEAVPSGASVVMS
jgi:N-acetylglucosamine kinase-like BadF-type ATPase